MTRIEWVIGATGQLGTAISRAAAADGAVLLSRPVRWADAEASAHDLRAGITALLADPHDSYHVYWAAGASVTSATSDAAARELEVFSGFVSDLASAIRDDPRALSVSFFFASSAGGVYSGSPSPAPFTEESTARSITPYGDSKLAMEAALGGLAHAGAHVLVGRISTLYGPDQRISKPQGFISHLCRSYISRTPLSVYVPLDTMRDYIHSDDAAAIARRGLLLVSHLPSQHPVVIKNVGSLAPSTLGNVLAQAALVFKRRPSVILATSALSTGQVRDLRIASVTLPELDEMPRRQLLVGLAETRAALEHQLWSIR